VALGLPLQPLEALSAFETLDQLLAYARAGEFGVSLQGAVVYRLVPIGTLDAIPATVQFRPRPKRR
jgi:hypothetical protein